MLILKEIIVLRFQTNFERDIIQRKLLKYYLIQK